LGTLGDPRRGSGVVVRPYRDWSIEVLAAYLRYGKPEPGQPTIARILIDMLSVRRAIVLEVVRFTASRIPKGGTAGARAAMARAWSMRNTPAFPREDFEVMRQVAEAARFTPGLWLLNRISKLWLDAASEVSFAIQLPDDYVAVYSKFFDLLELGDGEKACAVMAGYFERHDAHISKALSVMG
jgi:DNA-binding FadR family transcriptional regulator